MKQNIRETSYFRLEALSPLHVGSGIRYQPGLDYEIRDGFISVLSQNLLFQYMEPLSTEKIAKFSQAIERKNIFNELRNDTNFDSLCRYRKPFNIGRNKSEELHEIHEQFRDASGNPLIPGSSLKGAIRTAILQYLVLNDRQKTLQQELDKLLKSKEINPKYADNGLIKKMLGDDPKYNLMKTVTVGDLVFERQHITPMVSKTTRLINEKDFEAKKFAMGIEAIPKGAVAYGFLSFDEYLKNKANHADCFKFRAMIDTGSVLKFLRNCTSLLIQGEMAFLKGKKGDYLPELLENYRYLNTFNNTLGENEAFFNLGWGIGWRGMTGALLSEDDLKGVRNKLKLAPKHNIFPFPKSRRIALTDHNEVQLLGWVRLSVCTESEYHEAMTQVKMNCRKILREAGERKDLIDKVKAEEDRKLAAIQKEKARREDELRRQREEEERYPWRIHMKRLEGIQDWGTLRTQVLENQELIKFQNNPEVGNFVRELAETVREKWQNKWNQDRDAQVASWLKPSGFEWPPSMAMESNEQSQLSDADKEIIDKIEGLRNWDQYKNSGLIIDNLPGRALNKLRDRFKEWNCEKSDAKQDKKEAWKNLKRQIKHQSV